jgi:glycosyltransferase involved in cell wall biosynthesis
MTSPQPRITEGEKPISSRRLGIYYDTIYQVVERNGQRRASSDRSFVLFMCAVGGEFERLVIFGRAKTSRNDAEYVLPEGVELVELPAYSNLRQVFEVAAAAGATVAEFWRGVSKVDTLWVFGPHPFAAAFALLALLRRKQVVLGVRQHSVKLYATRLHGWRRLAGVSLVRFFDLIFRGLGHRVPVTVQGAELEAWYRGPRPGVLTMTESVIRAADVVDEPAPRDWTRGIELLTVGRLEPEKNPRLLVDALARLDRDEPGRYRLIWVGRGPLEDDTRAYAAATGVLDQIDFRGYVAFDGGLLDLYRNVHAFVHVSLSEGMPKVLIEALASGTATVATDVGGVRAAVDGGRAALLVPPDDVDALVAAIRRVVDDRTLRDELVRRGLELAQRLTLEAEARRVVEFMANGGRLAAEEVARPLSAESP